MEKLTTGSAIVEQRQGTGVYNLSIPKSFISSRGLIGGDTLYVTSKIENDKLILELSEYKRDGAISRSIANSAGYCRFVIPRAIQGHDKGTRWEAYTDGKGLLKYESAL